ncbi:MAG: hypothetical protein ABT940_10275 [Alphaproteobacteria bacterium]
MRGSGRANQSRRRLPSEIIEPPKGLDPAEIVTDQGLLQAVRREVRKIEDANAGGRLPNRDDVRLVLYLAGEIRRRMVDLTPEQMEQLDEMRRNATNRDNLRRVREMAAAARTLLEAYRNPSKGLSLSRFSAVEVGVAMDLARAGKEGWDEELTNELLEAQKIIQQIKNATRARVSLESF